MLLGVLRMPMPENPDPLTLRQFVSRAQQAACRIEADTDEIEELREALRNIVAAADMHPAHLEQAIGRARRLCVATASQQPVEPACPMCNRTPVFEHDQRVNGWAGHCKHCAVEGPVASTEAGARRRWIVWHHKRSDAQSLLVNVGANRF